MTLKSKQRIMVLVVLAVSVLPLAARGAMETSVKDDSITVAGQDSLVISATTMLKQLRIGDDSSLSAPEGYLLSLVVDGVEQPILPGIYSGDVALVLTEDYSDAVIGSFTQRGGEVFRAGLYVDDSGIVEGRSVEEAVTGGTFDASGAEGITIESRTDDFNGIIVNGAEYRISGSTVKLIGESDGSNTNDFSGLGSVIAAYNDAKVTMDNVVLYSEGVARPTVFTDAGAHTLVTDSTITSMGGKLYDGYVNTADQTKMVAPPWVLGITGNARTTNLMGELSSTTVVRTDASANQWGVLSTDSGKDMVLTVVDSTLTLKGDGQEDDPFSTNYGSGYGSYIIGDAKEYFYGVTFNVGTYASIITEGFGYYGSSNFDGNLDVYPLKRILTGETAYDWMGNPFDAYVTENAEEPVFSGITGEGRNTVVNSDAFGFMAHNNGTLIITDGTEVNTDNAVFLMKAGNVDMTVSDGARLNAADGVLLQIIDNDDSIIGADFSQGPPNFNTEFFEKEGYPGINYDVDVTTEGRNTYRFMATDVDLDGHLYNGSGYFGGQAGDALKVVLGSGATLEGDISATSVIHVDENGDQNTYFTIDEYYYLGHVANRHFYNGANDVDVSVIDGAVWTVEGTCFLSSLNIDDASEIRAVDGRTLALFVDGVETAVAPGSYAGAIVLEVK